MKINEIEGKIVKLSKTSITVKNEAGKTAGVVRNLRRNVDFTPRDTSKFWKWEDYRNLHKYHGSGVTIDNLYMDDDQLYLIVNKYTFSVYERLYEKYGQSEDWYDNAKQLIESLENIQVIYVEKII